MKAYPLFVFFLPKANLIVPFIIGALLTSDLIRHI